MKFSLVLGLLMTISTAFAQRVEEYNVNYSDSADLAKEHSNFKLTDVRYFELAKKVEISDRPGCNQYGEGSDNCQQTRVLERTPVIQVFIQYTEGIFRNPDYNEGKVDMAFNFPLTSFTTEEVEMLKANSGLWDFTGRKFRVRRAFLQEKFSLVVKKETRTIQVVDTRNSRLCPPVDQYPESGNCREVIVYKPSTTVVNAVKINLK